MQELPAANPELTLNRAAHVPGVAAGMEKSPLSAPVGVMLFNVTADAELLLSVMVSPGLDRPTPVEWKLKTGGKKFKAEAAAAEEIFAKKALPEEVSNLSWYGGVDTPEELRTGKLFDVVLPVTYALPILSTAMPLAESVPLPPR
jgi:hypothetical protein